MQKGTGGFTFCGVDVGDLGLHYAPPLNETYVYSSGDIALQQQVFESHNGGYFYGYSRKPKKFKLRCFFEQKHINDGVLSKIENLFRLGRTGRLIFKQREWLWYNATVTGLDMSGLTNYMNGIVVIQLTAYYPYGRTDFSFIPQTMISIEDAFQDLMTQRPEGMIIQTDSANGSVYDTWSESKKRINRKRAMFNNIKANTNLLQDKYKTETILINGTIDQTEGRSMTFPVYYGGTVDAPVAIRIAGNVGEGVGIYNTTNLSQCSFIAMTKQETTYRKNYVVCDALSGKTYLQDFLFGKQMKFLYHDSGFLYLKPCEYRKINNVHFDHWVSQIQANEPTFTEEDVGKYIFINAKWYKIIEFIDDCHIKADNVSGSEQMVDETIIATMNEITIKSDSDYQLDYLQIQFTPTFL